MNLQQLQYFKVVAEIGHMTKASEVLHISQPALSMSLSSLEAELGAPLFDKKGRLLQLTRCGEIFLGHISTAIQEIDDARSEIGRIALSANRTIHISSTYSLSSTLLPEILRPFHEKYPDSVVHLEQGPNMELIQRVVEEKTDFVFGRIPPEPGQFRSIRCLPLFTEELVILMHRDHPLADREGVGLEELREESFIFFHESTGFNLIVMDLFNKASFKPNIHYQVHDNSTCAALVYANLGVAIVSPAPSYDTRLVRQVRITSPPNSTTQINLTWNERVERAAPALYLKFLDHVRELYPEAVEKT